jgi:hypothetical protein
LAGLSELEELRCLDLIGTQTTTAGVMHLIKLPRLQVLLLPWTCSNADRAVYQQQLPSVTVLSRPYWGWREARWIGPT